MKKMTMMQHFAEMRRRILWTFGVFVVALVFGWYVSPWVQDFLSAPLLNVWPDGTMLYSGINDGFMIRMSLAFLVAIFVSIPVALWQTWAFVAPGLKNNERNFIFPILILSPILFLVGAGFAFYALLPFVFRFFIEINEAAPVPSLVLPAVRDYLSFAVSMIKVFGIAFQLPLVMVVLNRLGVLSRERVLKMRRYAIVFIVIVAAVLTPPDVVSQILLAVPVWLLFEASILFMRKE
ncbi:MAG: twin-arginine translocase subunit TatC [Alphaproteobacteria bacterium]|nr:twin-arginine translocase subunit TatC [Alphaproteobacteria bacterium]